MPINADEFKNPSARLRGAPFWSLNNDLTDHARLRTQIDAFADMGMGGFHVHVRSGLQTEYLSDDFFAAVKVSHEHAQEKGLRTYLYDEDRWPSGFAGGFVTKDHNFRQRQAILVKGKPELHSLQAPLAAYRVEFDDNDYLKNYSVLTWDDADLQEDWFLFREISADSPRFNDAAYLDVLNPKAVRAFIDSTHERYLEQFGGTFPEDVPSMFTDEPQMARSHEIAQAQEGQFHIPWTEDLNESYNEAFQEELLQVFPELVWSYAEHISAVRWKFRSHISQRFINAYSKQIGDWCKKHNIASTGHLMGEENLTSQLCNVGECMGHYPHYQIPGIDLLCNRYEASTLKQTASVARQNGCSQVLSELYGVTNWDFDFSQHKYQGDWQAALGVNLRVHHLAWLSMEGASKRDYPAAIGPQSPWYKEYKSVEDHFSRVHAALEFGKTRARVGVIHPIESAWLHFGVASQDGIKREDVQFAFDNILNNLLEQHYDFDFIAESILPDQYKSDNSKQLHIGEMRYDVVILPELSCIRSSTLEILLQFIHNDGRVVCVGSLPEYIDGAFNPHAPKLQKLQQDAQHISATAAALNESIKNLRDVAIVNESDNPIASINLQLRENETGDERVLFCSNRLENRISAAPWAKTNTAGHIKMQGIWSVEELYTDSGEQSACDYFHKNGNTYVPWTIYAHDHRCLYFIKTQNIVQKPSNAGKKNTPINISLPEPSNVSRCEENILLLDQAEWRINNEEWQAKLDCMLIQDAVHKRFNWSQLKQPYISKSIDDKSIKLHRSFSFENTIDLENCRLLCERLADTSFILDGQEITLATAGHYVDQDLSCAALPKISAGQHTLEITQELNEYNNAVEYLALLGNFGVHCRGAHAKIVAEEKCNWGDIVHQDMPFYGGNLSYEIKIDISETGYYQLCVPSIGGHCVRVYCDNEDKGLIAYDPYTVDLGELSPGEHILKLTCYGNHYNTFAALHNTANEWRWWGDPAWFVKDIERNDCWQFKPTGILRAPILKHSRL